VAEDNPVSRQAVNKALAKRGYEVLAAGNGDQAWEILQRDDAPRLVLLDSRMPGLSGIEICRRVRLHCEGYYKYIILLTERADPAHLITAISAGADDYITKPFNLGGLQMRLLTAQRILDLQQALSEKLNAQTEAQTRYAEQLLTRKDRLINQLAHDLKAPLTPLVALLPAVAGQVTDHRSLEMLDVVNDSVEYMRSLVCRTLELARFDSDRIELELTEFDLEEEINRILAGAAHQCKADGITVITDITPPIPVRADRLAIREVLENLISNSIKYMGGPGTVIIKAQSDGWTVSVSVSDTGIGLTSEGVSRIFDEFYRGEKTQRDKASSGLGLSICRRIVERHNGTIRAESPGPGKGATVSFTLEAARLPAESSQPETV